MQNFFSRHFGSKIHNENNTMYYIGELKSDLVEVTHVDKLHLQVTLIVEKNINPSRT